MCDALYYAAHLMNVTPHGKAKRIPVQEAYQREVNKVYLKRFKTFGALAFYDEGTALFIGFCPESTTGTALLYNSVCQYLLCRGCQINSGVVFVVVVQRVRFSVV